MSMSHNIPSNDGRRSPTPVTFGRLLSAARDRLGLSLEDAAHETRIQSSMLRWLEEGNIAAFGSITYARSFIRAYSVFLDLDPTAYLKTLPERGLLGGKRDYRYLTESQGAWLSERGLPRKDRLRAAPEPPSVYHIKSPVPAGVRAFAFMLAFTALWSVHMRDVRAHTQQVQSIAPQSQGQQLHAKNWAVGQSESLHTAVAVSRIKHD